LKPVSHPRDKPVSTVFGYIRVKKMNPRGVRSATVSMQLVNLYCDVHGLDLKRVFTEVSDVRACHPEWSVMVHELNKDRLVSGVVVVRWQHFDASPYYAHCMAESMSGKGLYMAKQNAIHFIQGGPPVWPPVAQ